MAEQMKEAADFLNKLEEFFLYDDQSRWKAIGWTIGIAGSLGTIALVLAESSVDDTVLLMGTIILLMSVGWIGWYCSFRPYQKVNLFSSRRRLVFSGIGSMVALFSGVLLSRVQAWALNSDLLQATKTNDYRTAAQVFERARTANVHLDKGLVRSVNQKLVSTVSSSTTWDAVIAGLNYHSSLASGSVQSPIPIGPEVEPTKFYIPYPHVIQRGTIDQYGTSRSPNIPQLRALDAPNLNEAVQTGPSFLRWEGGSLLLDDLYVKRWVLVSAHIIYKGGRLAMDSVSFLQCTFEIDQTARGMEFAKALLASNSLITISLS